MTKTKLLSQIGTKQIVAEALRDTKKRNGWSNAETGDAMGCGEGTVRNRLDDEDASHQMTVHELRRLIAVDGSTALDSMIADLGYRTIVTDDCQRHADPMTLAAAKARAAADLIAALSDGNISREEAARLLPQFECLVGDIVHMKGQLRAILRGAPVT